MKIVTSYAPDSIGWTINLPEKELKDFFMALSEFIISVTEGAKSGINLYNTIKNQNQ